jgi:hypothetical protein
MDAAQDNVDALLAEAPDPLEAKVERLKRRVDALEGTRAAEGSRSFLSFARYANFGAQTYRHRLLASLAHHGRRPLAWVATLT